MKKIIVVLGILITLIITANLVIGIDQAQSTGADKPTAQADGSKWRIAYCESEKFITYPQTLVAVIRGLEEIGWITNLEGFDKVANSGDSKTIWNWLATREVSPYIDFVDDACYNLRDADVDKEDLIDRLKSKKDIDLMLVMGAAAGNLLSNADHDTNIFVFAASNAVRSGIIASVEDSGKDNVWAHMDEQRF